METRRPLCLVVSLWLSACIPDVNPAVGPSCEGLAETCGLQGESCCARSVPLQGGTFNRDNDPNQPATLSDFVLDRFEVTVGRFRKFVEKYPNNRPKAGAGAHPRIANSGWDPAWDASLPGDAKALSSALQCGDSFTWTSEPGPNEDKPLSCVTFFEAFAFCAWDGGRLPTNAEWAYAAVGGREQRSFPWGDVAPGPERAVYDCLGDGSAAGNCLPRDILVVGSKSPAGDGRWGHADLAGNLAEWALDWAVLPYTNPCADCAQVTQDTATQRLVRGGSFHVGTDAFMALIVFAPQGRDVGVGLRCAREP